VLKWESLLPIITTEAVQGKTQGPTPEPVVAKTAVVVESKSAACNSKLRLMAIRQWQTINPHQDFDSPLVKNIAKRRRHSSC